MARDRFGKWALAAYKMIVKGDGCVLLDLDVANPQSLPDVHIDRLGDVLLECTSNQMRSLRATVRCKEAPPF